MKASLLRLFSPYYIGYILLCIGVWLFFPDSWFAVFLMFQILGINLEILVFNRKIQQSFTPLPLIQTAIFATIFYLLRN